MSLLRSIAQTLALAISAVAAGTSFQFDRTEEAAPLSLEARKRIEDGIRRDYADQPVVLKAMLKTVARSQDGPSSMRGVVSIARDDDRILVKSERNDNRVTFEVLAPNLRLQRRVLPGNQFEYEIDRPAQYRSESVGIVGFPYVAGILELPGDEFSLTGTNFVIKRQVSTGYEEGFVLLSSGIPTYRVEKTAQQITFADTRNPKSLSVTLKPAGRFEPTREESAVLKHFGVPGEMVLDCRFGTEKCVEYEMGNAPKTDEEVFALWEKKSRTTIGPRGEGLPLKPSSESASWPFFAAAGFFVALAGLAFWKSGAKPKV